jgi:hypothetical protein
VVNASNKGLGTQQMKVGRGKSVTAAQVAKAVSLLIPKRSQGVMRISIVKGGRYCMFVGTTIKGIRAGKCSIAVVLMPKKGKTVIRNTSLTVR